MAVQIILKNSSVEDKRPTANQLTNGEVSLNYHEDGAFLCCRDTDGNIQQIGGIKIDNDAPGTPVKGTLWLQPNTSTLFVHNGSSWLAIAGGGGGGGGGGAIDRIVAGDGIDVAPATGIGVVTVNADIDTERGLEFVAGEIAVKLGTGLSFNTTTGAIDSSSTALVYKGTIDLTTAGDVPANPDVGDTYANVGSGAFDSDWVTATGEPAGTLADPGDLVVWNGTVWTFIPTGSPGGGGGVTNLTYTPTTGGTASQGGTVVSSTGTDADIPMAGHSDAGVLGGAAQAGLMSPGDKTKLDSIDTDFIGFTAGRALTWDDTSSPDTLNADIATEAALGVVRIGNGLDITDEGEVSVDASEITTGIDLGYTAAATSGTVTNTAGDNADIPFATSALAGLFIEGATPAAGEGTTQYVRQVTEAGVATWEEAPSGGGASVNVGDTAPADPDEGDLWYDTNCDVLKVFDDTDTWVESSVAMPTGGDTADDCREKVFYENEQQVDFDYTLNAGTNAMSAGPITIADGVSVGVPNGQTWTIVGGSDNSGGGGGDSGFWQRAGTTLSPVTAGDDVDLGTGDLSAAAGTFSDDVSVSNGATISAQNSNILSQPVPNSTREGYSLTNGPNNNGAVALRLNYHFQSTASPFAVNIVNTNANTTSTLYEIDNNGNHLIGGTLPASPNITLDANGEVRINRAASGSVTIPVSILNGLVGVLQVRPDGTTNIGGSLPNSPNISLAADGEMRAKSWSVLSDSGSQSDNRKIKWVSGGTASNPVFIGNAQIQVTSDQRIKRNIKDTELDALSAIQQIKVKDFSWDDPLDVSYNNKNARGVWTGVIAQELVEILPFVVNAPRKEEDLSVDYESEELWTLDQSQLCPVLIKALQQSLTRIEALEAEVQSLKEVLN